MKILQYPDPFLTKIVENDCNVSYDVYTLMLQAVMEHNFIGLAANQIGKNLRLILVSDGNGAFRFAYNPTYKPTSNAKVVKFKEACGSLQAYSVFTVNRFSSVSINYTNLLGDRIRGYIPDTMEGIIWQHEIDHLNGILINKN